MKLPKARTENIVVQTLKDEVLVYDLSNDQAFCLNETSAKVFNACDGTKSFDDLKAEYKYTDEIIYLSLDGLNKENLIEDNYVSPFAGMNRREVIRKVGLASMIALPAISSLIAPTGITASSITCTTAIPTDQGTCPTNQRCVNGSCVACVAAGQPIPVCNLTTFYICCNHQCLGGQGSERCN